MQLPWRQRCSKIVPTTTPTTWKGDFGAGTVMLEPREAYEPDDKVPLKKYEPMTATFALKYLVTFTKAAAKTK